MKRPDIHGGGNVCTTCDAVQESQLTEAEVTLSYTECTYRAVARKPKVTVTLNGTTLTKNTDYKVTYTDNVDVGTATVTITGINRYEGTVTKYFTINQRSLSWETSGVKVKLSTTTYTYNGVAKKPTPTVTATYYGTTQTLVKGTDYTVSYSNNTKAGTATVTIKGIGNYKGTVKKTFKIKAKSLSSGSLTLSKTSYTYSGSAKKPSTTVKLTVNGTKKTLKKNTDYTVTYKNNKSIGTATVTIKGKGNYSGSIKKTFKIIPKKVTVKSVSSTTAKQIVLKWSKVSGGVKYQIYYRVKGTSTWKKTTVSSSAVKKTLKSLKAAKTYQIKIRAYKKVSGKTYYGAWSSVQTCKAKSDKIVYLTFDDGPSENMGEILDILDEYGVKATFFVTGNGSAYRSMITRAYNEGHAIGLHSYSHNYKTIYSSVSGFYSDLAKIQDLVEDLTGEKSYLLRFPGGSSNKVSKQYCSGIMTKLTASVESKGYTYFDWNVDSTDASGNGIPVATIVKNATSSSASEIDILMHCTDSKDTTVEALPQIIEYYQNKGYDFEVLSSTAATTHHHLNN